MIKSVLIFTLLRIVVKFSRVFADPPGYLTTISTVAGSGSNSYYGDGGSALQAGFSSVVWTWVDKSNRLYVSDYLACGIRVVSLTTGIISRFAGGLSCSGTASDGSPATSSQIYPVAIFGDSNNDIYFTDIGGVRVRKISTSRIITTIAGSVNGYADGDASVALFSSPYSLWIDSVGNFFVIDFFNCALRKITRSTSKVSTIVGQGPNACGYNGDNQPGTSTQLNQPYDAMGDTAGNIYIVEQTHRVRLLSSSTGRVTTFAGTGVQGNGGNNIPAISCPVNNPIKVWVDTMNNVYFSEYDGLRIRRVDTSGIIVTFAGTGVSGFSGDGGAATLAKFNLPRGLAMDTLGRMFIGDMNNYRVRMTELSFISAAPSLSPTTQPTMRPTMLPTVLPTPQPSRQPTVQPSRQPTVQPSRQPTVQPSRQPTVQPSSQPSSRPSSQPSSQPSTQPSSCPSCDPTSQPSGVPTAVPSGQPSVQPSRQPTGQPSSQPSSEPSGQPTGRPTCLPTSQPSSAPTQQPTVRLELLTIPVCTQIIVDKKASTVSVSCIFSQVSLYAGTLYCSASNLRDGQAKDLALLNNQTTAATRIMTTGTPMNFLPNQRNVSMTLIGLTPLAPYLSDCAIRLNDGRVSPFSDIEAMQRRWNTSCCKSISFNQHPAIIFEDIDAYYDASNFQSHYVFTFQLSSLPRNELIVRPQLLFPNSSMVDRRQYKISPASFQFISTSTSSTGSFVVIINGSLPEFVYLLSLSLFGSSVSEYDAILPSVEVFVRQSTPLPPSLSQANVGDSGKDMFINFNSPTNQANYLAGQVFPCSQLFAFPSSNKTSCYFLNSTTIRAIFPAETNVTLPQLQDDVAVLSNKIKAACASSVLQDVCEKFNFTTNALVSIAAPVHPVIPNVIIIAPSLVGICDNITFSTQQTSGLGGRPALSARWTVYSISGLSDTSNIEERLNSYGVDCIRSFSFSKSLFGLEHKPDTFSLSLQITNWMGYTSSSTVIVKVSFQSSIPRLQIFDSRTRYMTSNQVFETFVKAYYSSCDNTTKALRYSWTLSDTTLSNSSSLSLISSSNDPTIYALPAYSLKPTHVYQLRLEVSIAGPSADEAAVGALSIVVKPGLLFAVILGGSLRSVPFNRNITFDGSASSDEDAPPSKSTIVFAWSCSVISLRFFGQQCTYIFAKSVSNSSRIVVRGDKLETNVTYSLQLRVSTADGRSAVAAVSVVRSPEYSAFVSIASVKRQFNTNKNLTLDGNIEVNSSVIVTWEAFIEGKNYSFGSFTPLRLDLEQSYVANSFVYSLIASANTFKPGTQITFRLTAFVLVPVVSSSVAFRGNESHVRGRQLISHEKQVISMSEILLIANGPASSGSLQVEPPAGLALSTDFFIQTSGWVDSPSNYPLTFAFYFRQFQSDQPALTIRTRSTSPFVTSDLPRGNPFYQYRMIVEVVVYNVQEAQERSSTSVEVYPNPNLNITSYLSVHLTEAFARTDADLVFATVNNVGEMLNQVNCTLASPLFCRSLHRNPCENEPQTCGSCLAGFEGIVGTANSLCFQYNATNPAPGMEGDPCKVNNDCLYGDCQSGRCETPELSCPSVYSNQICSGHGRCGYFDLSGKEYKSPCLITDVYCKSACVCESEYGGRDCSLLSSELNVRDGNRGTMCKAIVQITNMTRITTSLVSSLINSLYVSYDPVEVFSETAEGRCSQGLKTITNLVADGYLVGEGASTSYHAVQQTLVNTISNYAKTNKDGRYAYLDGVMTKATQGMLHTMKNGQRPIVLTAPNVQININKELVSNLKGALLAPPSSDAEAYYGTKSGIRFELVGNAAEGCESSKGYSHFSVMQWGNNPFPNASSVESPMLRFAGKFGGSSSVHSFGMTDMTETWYFVVLPFTQRQRFFPSNTSAFVSAYQKRLDHRTHPRRSLIGSENPPKAKEMLKNLTFPDCTIFENGGYVSCGNCNIFSFTPYNVTFKCRNVRNLCQISLDGEGRKLVGDDDYFNDDSLGTGQGMTAEQYGALLQSAASFFASTLSSNPFAVNIEEAKTTLAFVGSLIFAFIVGLFLLRLWDVHDRLQFFYAHQWPPKPLFHTYHSSSSSFEKKGKEFQWLEGSDSPMSVSRTSLQKPKIIHYPSFRKIMEPLHSEGKAETPNFQGRKSEKQSLFDGRITKFFDLVIPEILRTKGDSEEEEEAGDAKKGTLQMSWRVFYMLLLRHDYSTIFSHSSAETNRVMRWMDLFNGILNGLFISTLFYGTFYSNNGECESYVDQASCVAPLNSITGLSQCKWTSGSDDDSQSLYHDDSTGSCSLQGPPGNFVFVIILALTCTLVAMPLQFIVQYALDEYCRKRPRLEDIGLDTEEWLGLGVKTAEITYEHNKDALSHFQRYYMKTEKALSADERAAREESNKEDALRRALFHALTSEEEVQHILQTIHQLYEGSEKEAKELEIEHGERDQGRKLGVGHGTDEEFIFLANLPSKLYTETWKEFNDARKQEVMRILQCDDEKFTSQNNVSLVFLQ